MYKSQLQEYAQKAGFVHPTYNHVKEGASHEPRFKATVWVNNQSYESAPSFSTVRSAQHAAAKVALDFLQKSQTPGVVPSPVHESGLCKNLLQEYAQKNGYSLPLYKLMRQGEEHSLIFTAAVEIAGVSYSGGGAKSKKEAEIKAARTALLAMQATQPAAAMGLPAMEPRSPLTQSQPGQIAKFVKSHPKRKKKRGRSNPLLTEEPLTTRMKQCLGHILGPMQFPQIHQVHQMHEMPQALQYQMPQIPQISQVYQMPKVSQSSYGLQAPPLNQCPPQVVDWNQELGVYNRATMIFNELMQIGNVVSQDSTMTLSEWETRPAGMEPTLDTKVFNGENHLTTALGNTESAKVQQTIDAAKDSQVFDNIPMETTNYSVSKEYTDSFATTGLKETVPLTGVHVSPASTSEVLLVQPQFSTHVQEGFPASQVDQVSIPITTEITTPQNLVGAQEQHTLSNGELQAEILRAMNVGIKSFSSEAS